jgi:pepF/M3 family oligoendopeptidase
VPDFRRSAAPVAAGPETDALPRWDMTVLYPGLDSPEFAASFAALLDRIAALGRLFDDERIAGGASAPLTDEVAVRFERILGELNATVDDYETMNAYLYSFVTTDSRNDQAQARVSELQRSAVALSKAFVRWDAWIGTLDIDLLIERSPAAAAHAFSLRKSQEQARHQMLPAEEALAAELRVPGGIAWAKLYDNVTSQILVELEQDGEIRRLPMSRIRNFAYSPDRDLRARAYRAELGAWEASATPLAAALNGIKGEANTLLPRRAWADPLDEAVFNASIDRETLAALIAAAREAFPDFRRYLRRKAAVLGQDRLAWYDLFAPVGDPGRTWEWGEAVSFLEEQFGAYSDRLRDLMTRASVECWIDAGPRPGKTDGAFCMHLRGGESRILHNFTPSYDGVNTLAHEMGHAYHNLNEAGLTPLQRQTPMTLAETASTFCETIVKEAVLASASRAEQLFIVEQSLQGAVQVAVDIVSRFDFERSVFARRQERELSVAELCSLMLEAQRGTYGDGMDDDLRHPYMWAAKGHYYIEGLSFYNFPYLFGLLFGLGLYARYSQDPDGFRARYDDLLAHTGRAGATELAARWGIDLRDIAFWRSSLDVVRADIARFEELASEG